MESWSDGSAHWYNNAKAVQTNLSRASLIYEQYTNAAVYCNVDKVQTNL